MKNLFVVLIFSLFLGCAARVRLEGDAPTLYGRVKAAYDRGSYGSASQMAEHFLRSFPGDSLADDVQMMLAKSYFGDKLYDTAANEFRRLIASYPESPYAPEAQFMVGKCLFASSPRAELDQSKTLNAIDALNLFLLTYPDDSALVLRANATLDSCYDKLAEKTYKSAVLYFKMHKYKPCIIYTRDIRREYQRSRWVAPSLFLEGKALIKISDEARARAVLDSLITTFPQNKDIGKAQKLLKELS